MPFVAALDGGERDVTIVGESAVGGVRPGNDGVEMLDDLPLGKETLGLRRVGELERAQEESPGVEFDGGDAGRHGGTITAEARRDLILQEAATGKDGAKEMIVPSGLIGFDRRTPPHGSLAGTHARRNNVRCDEQDEASDKERMTPSNPHKTGGIDETSGRRNWPSIPVVTGSPLRAEWPFM